MDHQMRIQVRQTRDRYKLGNKFFVNWLKLEAQNSGYAFTSDAHGSDLSEYILFNAGIIVFPSETPSTSLRLRGIKCFDT